MSPRPHVAIRTCRLSGETSDHAAPTARSDSYLRRYRFTRVWRSLAARAFLDLTNGSAPGTSVRAETASSRPERRRTRTPPLSTTRSTSSHVHVYVRKAFATTRRSRETCTPSCQLRTTTHEPRAKTRGLSHARRPPAATAAPVNMSAKAANRPVPPTRSDVGCLITVTGTPASCRPDDQPLDVDAPPPGLPQLPLAGPFSAGSGTALPARGHGVLAPFTVRHGLGLTPGHRVGIRRRRWAAGPTRRRRRHETRKDPLTPRGGRVPARAGVASAAAPWRQRLSTAVTSTDTFAPV